MDTKLEFLRGTLDVLILKSLVWGPLHGYAVTGLIRRQSDDALLIEEGTLYPALWRLENKGLITSALGEPTAERGGKARTYFKPTATGLKEARDAHNTLMRLSSRLPGAKGQLA